MTCRVYHRGVVVAALLVGLGAARAGSLEPGGAVGAVGLRPTLQGEQLAEAPPPTGGPPACGSLAALYSGSGFRVWITRHGSMVQENPLRPLSPETVLVFQVSVNGRVASAFGPDPRNLRQAGAPQTLEEVNPTPIRWAASLDDLPDEIRVVSESGEVLLGPLAFEACGDVPRPRSAPVARTSAPKAPTETGSTTSRPPRPRLTLPKGAIPE